MKLLIQDAKLTLAIGHYERWLGICLSILIGIQLATLFWPTSSNHPSIFQAIKKAEGVKQQLNASHFDFFIYGTSNSIETDNHYYYDFSETYTFYVRSVNQEKDNYFGDLLMTFPQGKYADNYFSHEAFVHSNQMVISQDLFERFGNSMLFDLYKDGILFQTFSFNQSLPFHYGFSDFNFLEAKELIVLSFNPIVFENLNPNEKNKHVVFGNINDTSTSNMFGIKEVGYKNTNQIPGFQPSDSVTTVNFLPSMQSTIDSFYRSSLETYIQSTIFHFFLFYLVFSLMPLHRHRQRVLFHRFRLGFFRLWFSNFFIDLFNVKEAVLLGILILSLIVLITSLPVLFIYGLILLFVLINLSALSSFFNTRIFYTLTMRKRHN